MNNFYVTLPSNSSMNVFPNNTKSNFTTLLSQAIQLNGDYEVALTNVSFPSRFNVDCGQIKIKNLNCVFNILTNIHTDITLDLEISNGISQLEFVYYLNSKITNNLNLYQLFYHTYLFKNPQILKTSELFIKLESTLETNNFSNCNLFVFQDINHSNALDTQSFQSQRRKRSAISDTTESETNSTDNKMSRVAIPYIKSSIYQFIIDAGGELDNNYIYISFNLLNKIINEKKTKFKNIVILRYLENSKEYFDDTISDFNQISHEKLHNLVLLKEYQIYVISSYLTEVVLEKEQNLYRFSLYNSHPIKNENLAQPKFECRGLIKEFMFGNRDEFFMDKDYFIPENIFLIKFIAIYCDIIEEQFIGDASAPILQIIPIESKSSSQVISIENNTLHYAPVNKNYINTIKILVTDLLGNQIKFNNDYVYVIAKLHFRKI